MRFRKEQGRLAVKLCNDLILDPPKKLNTEPLIPSSVDSKDISHDEAGEHRCAVLFLKEKIPSFKKRKNKYLFEI